MVKYWSRFRARHRLFLENKLECARDLIDAALVAPTLKCRLEECVEYLLRLCVRDETAGENKDIGVVVLADKLCYLRTPCNACAYRLVLVQRHCDALA